MLKVLVGGDPISAEGKGLNGDFPMFGTFNIVMTCNSRLRVRLEGDTGAWRRRLLVVRYQKPPPTKRILDFDHVLLREEGSGILRWAMAGFVKLQAEFAESGDFELTDAQRGRVDSLLAESDSLRLFVKQRMARHDYGDVTTSEISQAYAEFCADKGWNALPTPSWSARCRTSCWMRSTSPSRTPSSATEENPAAAGTRWSLRTATLVNCHWRWANESGYRQTAEGSRTGWRHRAGPVSGLCRGRT